MRILFFGDVFGRSGRDGLAKHLPEVRRKLHPDAIVVNAENSAGGDGVTLKLAKEFFDMGIDCLTTGNHVWGQRELLGTIDQEPRILRPHNYPEGTPGRGVYVHNLPDGRKLLVVNIMARMFMNPILDDPFACIEKALGQYRLGASVQAILFDFHGEVSSEKNAMGHVCDGRVSAVLGTHTHVPSADARILPHGTAYQTDVGMCGDYAGIIGVKKEIALWRFTHATPGERMVPAEGEATICGAMVVTDDKTGLAKSITSLHIGGVLDKGIPEVD
ncbi:MAG: TIGR00282 family metallophosphoesterase [Bdellovibrionales bacterium]